MRISDWSSDVCSSDLAARKKLRSKVALKPEEVPTDEHGFAIMVGRREADGSLSIVGAVEGDPVLAERVVRKAAACSGEKTGNLMSGLGLGHLERTRYIYTIRKDQGTEDPGKEG